MVRVAAAVVVSALCALSAWSIVQPEQMVSHTILRAQQFDWTLSPTGQLWDLGASMYAQEARVEAARAAEKDKGYDTRVSSHRLLSARVIWWTIVAATLVAFGALSLMILLALGLAVCQELSRRRRFVIVRLIVLITLVWSPVVATGTQSTASLLPLLTVPQVPVVDPNHIVDPASGHVRLRARRNNNIFTPRPPHEAEIFFVSWVVGCLWLCGYFVRRGLR